MHQVLDEGARHHDADVLVEAVPLGELGVVLARRGGPRLGARVPVAELVLLHAVGWVGHRRLARHEGAVGGEAVGALDAARGEGVRPRHAHVAVRLLVVDEHVARVLRVGRLDLGRAHDVELAYLARSGQHLNAVRVIRHFVRLRREDAAAAEGARLVARDARVKARLGRGAALLVPARRTRRLVSHEWGEGFAVGLEGVAAYVRRSSGASAM